MARFPPFRVREASSRVTARLKRKVTLGDPQLRHTERDGLCTSAPGAAGPHSRGNGERPCSADTQDALRVAGRGAARRWRRRVFGGSHPESTPRGHSWERSARQSGSLHPPASLLLGAQTVATRWKKTAPASASNPPMPGPKSPPPAPPGAPGGPDAPGAPDAPPPVPGNPSPSFSPMTASPDSPASPPSSGTSADPKPGPDPQPEVPPSPEPANGHELVSEATAAPAPVQPNAPAPEAGTYPPPRGPKVPVPRPTIPTTARPSSS